VPPAALARSILPLARDASSMVRQEVASALPLGLDDDAVWQAIERLAVGDPVASVRSNCLSQLGSFLVGSTNGGHPQLVRAIELLNRMRADTDGSLRDRAQRLLEQLAAHHPRAGRLARESVAPADAKPADAVPGQRTADF